MPLVAVNETLVSWTLQRLSDLQVAPASNAVKMEEAAVIADNLAKRFLEPTTKHASVAKMFLA